MSSPPAKVPLCSPRASPQGTDLGVYGVLLKPVRSLKPTDWQKIFLDRFIERTPTQNGEEGCVDGAEQFDDMLFYVRSDSGATWKEDDGFFVLSQKSSGDEDIVFVRRRNINEVPERGVNWRETVYLNMIAQCTYTLTCSVYAKQPNSKWKLKERTRQRVFASASAPESVYKCKYGDAAAGTASPAGSGIMGMFGGAKEDGTHKHVCTFPDIFFTVENFAETFSNILVSPDTALDVELAAHPFAISGQSNQVRDREGCSKIVIFSGSVPYSKLCVGLQRVNSKSSKGGIASAITGLFGKKPANGHEPTPEMPVHQVNLRGPGGKGHAQVAVSLCEPEAAIPPDAPVNERESLGTLRTCLTFIFIPWARIIGDLTDRLLEGERASPGDPQSPPAPAAAAAEPTKAPEGPPAETAPEKAAAGQGGEGKQTE